MWQAILILAVAQQAPMPLPRAPMPLSRDATAQTIKLETPATVKVSREVNPYWWYNGPLCNSPTCGMCQAKRQYGNQRYATAEVPFCPTPMPTADNPDCPDAVGAMLDAVDLKPEDVLYDLGSGDGRIVISAVAISGCRAVGLDLDASLVSVASGNAASNGVAGKASFHERDATKVSLPQATVVTLYQDEPLLKRLLPTLGTLKDGSRIVSYAHPLPWVLPNSAPYTRVDDVPIYRYRVGTKTEKHWSCNGPKGCGYYDRFVKAIVSY